MRNWLEFTDSDKKMELLTVSKVDLSNIQAGVYILNVTLADGQKTATKLIKK